MRIGRHWIKACVCFLLFAALDVRAGGLPLFGKIRLQKYHNCGVDRPKWGYKSKTIVLLGGEKMELVWVGLSATQGCWIGKYEVTQAQWYGVMGSSPSSLKAQNRAVEYVSWEDCQEFCRRAGNGLRLPTKAEWLRAQKEAERFADSQFYNGDRWYLICHMRDNLWEWCEDGACRKDSRSRCDNSKSFRGEGLGFRICCPPSPLDSYGWLVDLWPIISILALIFGWIFGRAVWLNVKSGIANRKAAAVYEAKHGNVHPCAFCGQADLPTHAIYHSVFRRTDIRLREYDIDRCGFAVHTCDRCLWRHRLRQLFGLTLINTGGGIWLGLAFLAFLFISIGCAKYGFRINSPLLVLMSIVGCAIVLWGGGLYVGKWCCPRLRRQILPWRKLVERHPVVAELLKSGYELDDGWPRHVREGLDTDSRQRTLEHSYFKSQIIKEHETYRWMGPLQTFALDGRTEPKAAESLRYLQEREKRRGTPCTAKDLSLQRATKGILTIILVVIIYVIARLLK